jgi:hypothetical protein
MFTIFSFLVFCAVLAFCVFIGGLLLNLLFVALIAVIAGCVWAWEKLTGKSG